MGSVKGICKHVASVSAFKVLMPWPWPRMIGGHLSPVTHAALPRIWSILTLWAGVRSQSSTIVSGALSR